MGTNGLLTVACVVLVCSVGIVLFSWDPRIENRSVLSGVGGNEGEFSSSFLSTLRQYQRSQSSVLQREQQLSDAQKRMVNMVQQLSSSDSSNSQPSSGITYSTSTNVGVSSEDQSPDIPKSFLIEEERASDRMKKLKRELKKSENQQNDLSRRIKELNEFINGEVSDVRTDVRMDNSKLSDDISSATHNVEGIQGPPGLPGLPGTDGQPGENGFEGNQGPSGIQGSTGPLGPSGSSGPKGPQGLTGPRGYAGGGGATGSMGPVGGNGLVGTDNSWAPAPYFCPSAANEWTRLVDCNGNSCRLETNYDGVWGVICAWYFSQIDADVVCRGLGFEAGGRATYRFGNSQTGPIWLSNVQCTGNEGDIGDCPKTCGGSGCDRHVGLCCWGQALGEKGVRVSIPASYKTVQQFRDNCHFPPTCQDSGGPKINLHQNCGGAQSGGWQSALGVGDYPRVDGGTCDNDAGKCIIANCGLQAGDLSSMEIPAGLSVTLYSQPNFGGNFVTYSGPMDVDCLVWDGWNDATQSLKVSQAVAKAASQWTMRIFQSTATLQNMPSIAVLNFVGQAIVPFVNFHSPSDYRQYVAATPDQNFVAVFYGTVSILSSGKYTFCVSLDDGSYATVDDALIVNNGGLHGDQKQCGPANLAAGLHRVQVSMFQGGGGADVFLTYSGPDTSGKLTRPRSESGTDGLPPLPPTSAWTMRLFSSPQPLTSLPDWTVLNLLGTRSDVQYIQFSNLQNFRDLVSSVPNSNYMWVFYGSITIQSAGTYTLCVTSHDGSVLIIDLQLLAGDQGVHGPQRRCGSIALAAGDHDISVQGFSEDGAASVQATYSGPDTGGGEILLPSIGKLTYLPPCPVPPSQWTLSLYHSATYLNCLPDLSVLTYVGKAVVSVINFNSRDDFVKAIPNTPNSNFAWSFDGVVTIQNAGQYSFCTSSDDGSYISFDGNIIADDSGLHGMVQRCGTLQVSSGSHSVQITGFQGDGGVGEQVVYVGPDTGGVAHWLRSDTAASPNVQKASQFSMCIFQPGYWMSSIPWMGSLQYLGRGQMTTVNLNNLQQFRQYVSNTPEGNFGWGIYGVLNINSAGQYTLCITSDDGSREYLDGAMLINNDGLHGMVQSCASSFLNAGGHAIYIEGFQGGGGVGMVAQYSGPDTSGMVLLQSGVACTPTTQGCHT